MVNNPGFSLNKSNGGLNWGFCKEEPTEEDDKKKPNLVKYVATVTTSEIEKSETE